jgi:riboflavin synthase
MFTGIIIGTGRVVSIDEKGGDLELAIDAAAVDPSRLGLGESISVQGACLTVTRREGAVFYADVSRETMAKTTLGTLGRGSRVNLEPSLRAGDALMSMRWVA